MSTSSKSITFRASKDHIQMLNAICTKSGIKGRGAHSNCLRALIYKAYQDDNYHLSVARPANEKEEKQQVRSVTFDDRSTKKILATMTDLITCLNSAMSVLKTADGKRFQRYADTVCWLIGRVRWYCSKLGVGVDKK